MSESSARTRILQKIKTALVNPTPLPFPDADKTDNPVQPLQQDIVVEFAEQFTGLQGKFVFCINPAELRQQFTLLRNQHKWEKVYCNEPVWCEHLQQKNWYEDITTCEVAITGCELLVARTGSMVLSAAANGRVPSVYAPIHICIAYTSQLVYDITEALQKVKQKYEGHLPSFFSLATGPSRTADIEKTLVVGVHGPKEVYCFLVDDSGHTSL